MVRLISIFAAVLWMVAGAELLSAGAQIHGSGSPVQEESPRRDRFCFSTNDAPARPAALDCSPPVTFGGADLPPGMTYPDKAGVRPPTGLPTWFMSSHYLADDYPQMPGFPKPMGVGGSTAPTEGPILVDVDGDRDLELFAGSSDGYLYGWHHDGSNVLGFPIFTGEISSSPAAGDIDGDGDLEVLVGTVAGAVHAFHHNGSPVPGWSQQTQGHIYINSVALWDFDRDDVYEVFVGSDRLYVWQGDGSLMSGFPVSFAGSQYGTCSSSSVGDIDGDGDAEIIVEGWNYLNAFHHDGTVVQGWPYALSGYFGFSYSAPSLVDVDNDDAVEIFCAAHESGGNYTGQIHGLDGDGANLPGWPQPLDSWSYSTPAIGDMDGDRRVEIVLPSQGALLYAFETDGSPMPGWPVYFREYNVEAHPCIVDLDNDNLMDVVFGDNFIFTGGFQLYCYRSNGTPHPDFPLLTDGATMPTSSAVADVDGDGGLEIAHHVYNPDGATVYFWDVPYPAVGAAMPWPQPHHDVQHTGNYHHGALPLLVVDDADPEFGIYQGAAWPVASYKAACGDSTHYQTGGTGSNIVAWRVDNLITRPGHYDVYAWKFSHPRSSRMATNAHYVVKDVTGQSAWILKDLSTPGNEWLRLGNFQFDDSSQQGVGLSDNANGYVTADAVKFVYTGP